MQEKTVTQGINTQKISIARARMLKPKKKKKSSKIKMRNGYH